MKILAFVDTHGNLTALKKVITRAKKKDIDIVVCAGDLTMFGEGLDFMLGELNKIKKPVLLIPGNHEYDEEIKKACGLFDNCIDLHKKKYRIDDYLFFGYGEGGFSLIDKGFEKRAKQFKKWIKKEDKVVLMTHAPPYKTKIDRIGRTPCGNKSIRKFIEKVQPVLAVSGHLHENAGKEDKIRKSRVVNPGHKGKVFTI